MKKSYKFGEILLYLREEYKECNYLLEELKKYIHIPNNKNFQFKGNIFKEESKIKLIVEKEYSEILKKICWLKYGWYSTFLYTAHFNVIRKENSTYTLEENSLTTPIPDRKRFVPLVDILQQDKFDSLIDRLLSLDIMQMQKGVLYINHDLISLNLSRVFISSKLGYESFLRWDGNIDTIDYSIKKDFSPYLLERILYLEIPKDYIPQEWIQIFEKHESKFSDKIHFDVDINIPRKKGNLQIDTSNKKNIKLLRKKLQ